MSRRIAAKITGVSGYVPPRVMSNADLEKLVETDDAWIRERTGIRERHVAEKGVGTSDLATAAARQLLASKNVPASEIDLIVVASVTPDMMFPQPPAWFRRIWEPRTHGDSIFRRRVPDFFMPSRSEPNLWEPALKKKRWSSEAT